jgi:hypothetical protein
VELFAWALLTWPDMPPLLRRGMLAALLLADGVDSLYRWRARWGVVAESA